MNEITNYYSVPLPWPEICSVESSKTPTVSITNLIAAILSWYASFSSWPGDSEFYLPKRSFRIRRYPETANRPLASWTRVLAHYILRISDAAASLTSCKRPPGQDGPEGEPRITLAERRVHHWHSFINHQGWPATYSSGCTESMYK